MQYYTKDFSEWQILTSDVWLEASVSAMYRRQKSRMIDGGIQPNQGFDRGGDRILSSFAQQLRSRHLSPKQLVIARQLMPKYSGQLTQMANNSQ